MNRCSPRESVASGGPLQARPPAIREGADQFMALRLPHLPEKRVGVKAIPQLAHQRERRRDLVVRLELVDGHGISEADTGASRGSRLPAARNPDERSAA